MYFVQIYKTAENSKPLSADANQMVRTHKRILEKYIFVKVIVSDPNPDSDPHVFGPRSGSFYHQAKIVRKTLIPTVLFFVGVL
jgi:hypothetical protein